MGAAAHGTGLEGVTRGREELPPALERGSPRCGPSTPPAPMVPDVRYPHAHNHQVSLGATLTHKTEICSGPRPRKTSALMRKADIKLQGRVQNPGQRLHPHTSASLGSISALQYHMAVYTQLLEKSYQQIGPRLSRMTHPSHQSPETLSLFHP